MKEAIKNGAEQWLIDFSNKCRFISEKIRNDKRMGENNHERCYKAVGKLFPAVNVLYNFNLYATGNRIGCLKDSFRIYRDGVWHMVKK
jgi:hypothetical protein